MYGYAAREVVGRELRALLAPGRHGDAYEEAFSGFEKTGDRVMPGGTLELTSVKKDGAEFPIELSLSAYRHKEKFHAIGIVRDISARKKYEEELRRHREQLEKLVQERTEDLQTVNELLRDEILDRRRTEEELCRSESFLNSVFDSFHDPVSIVDRDYRIIKFNEAFARMRNRPAKDLYGKKCYEVVKNRNVMCKDCVVEKTFRSADPCATKINMAAPDGSGMWLEIYTYPILDQNQNVSHVVEYARDVTNQEKAEQEKNQLIKKLSHLSTTDGLTCLLNRRALIEVLAHEFGRADRYGADLSVILCDVDNLKKINDTYGHTAGDQALLTVSEMLRKSLRQSDIVGRYGGDEFMIILPETSLAGAESFAEKIRVAVERADIFSGRQRIRLSLSIGVAGFRTLTDTIDALVARADAALYASKNVGRNKVSVEHS
ncbi:MAG TPA: diguanylate cyclase, partial [Nitrospirota bacterium]